MRRSSHFFIHGNLAFVEGPEDAWAGFKLDGQSYPGLSAQRKIELKERLESFAYAVEADFQVIRLARDWSVDRYARRALATLDRRHGDEAGFKQLLAEHREVLTGRQIVRPETYLFVRLGAPLSTIGVSRLAEALRELKRAIGISDVRGISEDELGQWRLAEERTFDRLYDYLPCERVRSEEIAYLISSPYTRGLGEPRLDPNWRPQALWIDPGEDGGEEVGDEASGALGALRRLFGKPASRAGARFEPYEYDVSRLHNSRVHIERRSLRIESELGTSFQALLVVGTLAEEVQFPSADAELMFAPLELDFPVDAVFSAEYLPNPQAQKLAQKRMVDADQQAKEESYSEHGASPQTDERTLAARDLQMRMSGADRPPLLRSALTLAVGAESEEELERRVDRLRDEFGRTELHRPIGEQHRIFVSTMPGKRFPVPDYKSHLLPEEFGAMVPNAVSHVGSEIGPYIGYTLSGSRTPVQFDAAEACRQNRPPTVLLTGTLGSGKTMLMQLLEYQAFLAGSFICDIEPKGDGDHGLLSLPGVAERAEVIPLGPGEEHAGLLDPLRVGEEGTRAELAYTFLTSILPQPVPPEWQTEIKAAVDAVAESPRGTTGEVVRSLNEGTEHGRAAGQALDVHLRSGLARLGYGRPDTKIPEVGEAQVVALEIRNLTLPQPGTPRGEFQENERVSQAILSLVASYALRLCARDKKRHAVLAIDEAWSLLESSAGRALLSRISRLGRSQNLTPILASQIVGDAEQLEPLVGTYFAFGVETEAEARRALTLLGLDRDDDVMVNRLLNYRAGRAFMRHFDRLQAPMRVDPTERLLRAFDTTPQREDLLPHPGPQEESEPDEPDALAA
jgi:hypothetical protein